MQGAFCFIAYPALVITYLGQAAWLTQHADQVTTSLFQPKACLCYRLAPSELQYCLSQVYASIAISNTYIFFKKRMGSIHWRLLLPDRPSLYPSTSFHLYLLSLLRGQLPYAGVLLPVQRLWNLKLS